MEALYEASTESMDFFHTISCLTVKGCAMDLLSRSYTCCYLKWKGISELISVL